LRRTLQQLPGRKMVFSNAPSVYVQAVLKLLGVADLFDEVFAIEHAKFRPKPQRAGFLAVLREHHLSPKQCVMVEDSVDNLRTAKRLGMRTVWVSDAVRKPVFVDVKIKNITELPRHLAALN